MSQPLDPNLVRFCPERDLPQTVFLPGRGQSKPRSEDNVLWPTPGAEWWEIPAWLWGVDLFNHGYCWEAHEAWETVWTSEPRDSARGLFLRGCIQTAAALVKLQLGVEGGVKKLSERSLNTLRQAQEATDSSSIFGVTTAPWIEQLERYWGSSAANVQNYPRLWPQLPPPLG